MAERLPPMNFTGGVFDKPRQPRLEPRKAQVAPKPEMAPQAPESQTVPPPAESLDPFEQHAVNAQQTNARIKASERGMDKEQDHINRLNDAMNSLSNPPEEEGEKVSPQELALAEQLIFRGYAETEIEMTAFPGKKFVICSTSAEELAMIDEIIFDMVKSAKANDDGTVDIPENHVASMRNAVFVSLSYRGMDGKDFAPEAIYHLNTIKKAIYRINDLLNEGNIKDAEEFRTSLKKSILKRATLVKRMPTPMIDFLSGEKLRFDNKMSRIMGLKTILPKS